MAVLLVPSIRNALLQSRDRSHLSCFYEITRVGVYTASRGLPLWQRLSAHQDTTLKARYCGPTARN